MTISLFYAEAEPNGGYVEPFLVAYYFDFPSTMTVLKSDDQRVVDFLGSGGAIEPYEAPPEPAVTTPAKNGEALDTRQRASKKEEIAALLKSLTSPEADAIRKITELI